MTTSAIICMTLSWTVITVAMVWTLWATLTVERKQEENENFTPERRKAA